MRQIIGYLAVTHPDGSDRLVVVSQEITTDKRNVVVAARKVFTLDTIDGEEVIGCNKTRFFTLKDGQLLKVVGHCVTKEEDLLRYQMRRRGQTSLL